MGTRAPAAAAPVVEPVAPVVEAPPPSAPLTPVPDPRGVAAPVVPPVVDPVVPPVVDPVQEAALAAATAAAAAAAAPVVPPVVDPNAAPVVPPVVDPNAAPPAAGEFDEFEIELSVNSPLSEADLDTFVKEVEEQGLTEVQAKTLLISREAAFSGGQNALLASQEAENAANRSTIMAMPEFAPDKIAETNLLIKTVADKFGSPELTESFKGAMGNNPHLVKMMLNIANTMKPDTIVGKGAAPGAPVEHDHLKAAYPAFYKDEENKS